MKKNYIYVDTETTGLHEDDELLSISILDDQDICLFDSLIRPVTKTSWTEAMQVNGISPDMVKNAPTYDQLKNHLSDLFIGKSVVAYNLAFESSFLKEPLAHAKSKHCCMLAYADFKKLPPSNNHYKYKLHKLVDAVKQCNPDFKFKSHNSLEDCKATRVVWHYILSHNQYNQ